MNTICPYTLKPLIELPKTNSEHIFPHAIGGSLDYKLIVSEEANSKLGSAIDSGLINSPMISALRLVHGISSRSGPPSWTVKGLMNDTGKKVEVTFSASEDPDVHIVAPVEMNAERTAGTILVPAAEYDAYLADFVKKIEAKGKAVVFGEEHRFIAPEMTVDFSLDVLLLKRAMAKIAYGAAFFTLGDGYANDPLIPSWQAALFGKTKDEVEDCGLTGQALIPDALLDEVLKDIKPDEHVAFVANVGLPGAAVFVSLFGRSFHQICTLASETSNYGLEVGHGLLAVCDAKARATTLDRF